LNSKLSASAGKFLSSMVAVICCTAVSFAQATLPPIVIPPQDNSFAVYGGMGVSLAAAPGLVKYLNTLADPAQQVPDFGTNIEFFGGAEFPVTDQWGGALEYGYLFKSYTLPNSIAGTYTEFYSVSMPTAMAQYVFSGIGYFIKFGGGLGYHTGSLEQKDSYGNDITYSTHGIGFKAQAVGQTAFDGHFYGYIGGSMRWELLGNLKNGSGTVLQNEGRAASLSMFVVGVNFGVIYYF